ncbi:phosphatase PAP2 family protein [Arachidicoccus ginsenosidivorans]
MVRSGLGAGRLICRLLLVGLPLAGLHGQTVVDHTDTARITAIATMTDTASYGRAGFSAPSAFSPRQLITPGVLIGAGIAMDLNQGFKNAQLRFQKAHLKDFHTAADNILLYLPAAIPYGLDLLGVPSKTDVLNRTAILIKAEMMLTATGYLLKHTVHEWRPDGSNRYSFPSGHSLQVFATATLLSEEYRERYKWMPYAAYGLATGVGLLRVANNKHYIGDVLVGAGLGILTMKIAYWTHHYSWHKHSRHR